MEIAQEKDFEERAYLYAGILAQMILKQGGEVNLDMEENVIDEFSLIYKFYDKDGKKYLKMKVIAGPDKNSIQ